MAHLIVKDRKLCMVNGKYVTSANGAPCVCGDGGDGELDCDVPELPCAAFIAVQGVVTGGPVFGPDQKIEVLSFSGLNGVHKVSLDGSQDLGPIPIHLVIRITRLSNESDKVTLTFTNGAVSVTGPFCVNDRLCVSFGTASISEFPTSVEETNPAWTGWSAQAFLNETSAVITDLSEGLCLGLPRPDSLDTPSDGELFDPRSGSMMLAGWGFNCPPDEERTNVRLAIPCGDGDPIPIDLATNTEGRWNAKYQDEIYTITDEVSSSPPVEVEWVDEECGGDPGESSVWERCRTTGQRPIPEKVRCDSPNVQNADYMYSVFVFPTPQAGYPDCQEVRYVAYRRVVDDGGDYPSVSGSPRVGPCSNMTDSAYLRFCPSLDDAGNPQDPNNPAITDPGIKRTLPVQDLSGFDIEREIRAARQGGCCGQPVK
jgi:hypothetical protein